MAIMIDDWEVKHLEQMRKKIASAPPLPMEIDNEAWGDVIDWEELAPGVFAIHTTMLFRPSANKHTTFFAVAKGDNRAGISEKALQCAEEHNGIYYFGSDEQAYLIEYELSIIKAGGPAANKQKIREIRDEYEELGKDLCPEYFGTWPQPHKTPWGRVDKCLEVLHGMWLLRVGKQWILSVVRILTSNLSDITRNMGSRIPEDMNGPIFWKLDQAAPAIYELIMLEGCSELKQYITSMEELKTYLCQSFPDYVSNYNAFLDKCIEGDKTTGRGLFVGCYEKEKIKKTCPPVDDYLNQKAFHALG